ncbi:DUF4394 domain-containing protein [Cyclobacterium qasimii]|uniref:DUF4394 domain-containing protein n=2 Tax=Cyclobacterium qasimii TaxID=1350429 RepID=S7VP10_9BACT|nr:DUF4394 domain-containing protein [Cyclobacterium qasimii]EPR71102.1 hypothetical protein ADICYQ_0693 [Cyclobacterium qasimii M12-11B]GEO21631.1 hypothetical protein CQA01_21650 [Cyclobacterium qasimii]
MKKYTRNSLFIALFYAFTSVFLISCDELFDKDPVKNPSAMVPDVSFTALTDDNKIAWFNAQNLNNPEKTLSITGLPSGEQVISIDYRPATGQLYGLGISSRLYIINEQSGIATPLGTDSFSPGIMGDNASIDFNPTVDRVRLVTESGQNLRLHPELGTVVAEDGSINGGDQPLIGAVAYTNSMAGASSTKLYDIDFSSNKLFLQIPPNDGGLEEVGDLGEDFMGMGDFDINSDNSSAFAVTLNDGESKLYTIDLDEGSADWLGDFSIPVFGIAFKTDPVAYATSLDDDLYRFNPMNPGDDKVALTGLMDGEHIIGLDFRAMNGSLLAISNHSKLYTVNTSNGALSQVGSQLDPMFQSHESVGFDFNPTVDRIRLVTNSGQNFRLHPDLGTVVAIDGDLKPGDPSVNGAAYTNNIPNASTTELFVLDSEVNKLFKQDPPNDGVLVEIGDLGNSIESGNGFDIGGASGMAYALVKAEGANGIYTVNLLTGNITKVADFNFDVVSMSIGLGF